MPGRRLSTTISPSRPGVATTPGPVPDPRRVRAAGPKPPADRPARSAGNTRTGRPAAAAANHNLPLVVDSFLGRAYEVEGTRGLFAKGRVVTITGGPGMGKTRLSVEVGRVLAESYPQGVWMTTLAPLADAELVAAAVAASLSAPPGVGHDVVDSLVARIGDEHLLLLLDNCEHLLDACARLVTTLVEACPHLAVLATSQERLSIAGEHVWPLTGLSVPGPDDHFTPDSAGDAVALFEQRAQAAKPRFALTHDNLAAVTAICRRLDGIPLAIELAAARVATFSPAEIAAHLDDRFAFLTAGSRSVLPRHQTLQAAVDWSYDLLSGPEQALLRRLSVFAGGATLDAIQVVCAGGEVDHDDVVDLLAVLSSRSLIVPVESAVGSRFGLLETIRFYGRDRLADAGEVTATAARHVHWCLSLAETAEPHLVGPQQNGWLACLQAEHDNLRAAMAWSLAQGPTEDALRMSGALAMFWRLNGNFGEGLSWLDRGMAVSEGTGDLLRAKAWWGGAMLASVLGNWKMAVGASKKSLDLYEEHDDVGGVARSLLLLAAAPFDDRSVDEQLAAFRQVIALAGQAGDSWCLTHALSMCGSALGEAGDSGAGRLMLEESMAVARAAGDERGLRFALISFARVALDQGDLDTAERSFREAVGTGADGGRSDGGYESAVAYSGLAKIALAKGHYEAARHLVAEAERYADATPSAQMGTIASMKARLALAQGDVDAAARHLENYLQMIEASGTSPGIATLLGLGDVALAQGDDARAEELFSQALGIASAKDFPRHVAAALFRLAEVARTVEYDDARARVLHHQALLLRAEKAGPADVVESLEASAALAVRAGQPEPAARAYGSAEAAREAHGYARTPAGQVRYDEDLAVLQAALRPERLRAAWSAGRSLSLDAAVAYLSKRRGSRTGRPVSGVGSLTDAERQIAQLVAEGLRNAEIAERLFVSVYTVKAHLTKVFSKLGVTSRSELMKRFPKEGF